MAVGLKKIIKVSDWKKESCKRLRRKRARLTGKKIVIIFLLVSVAPICIIGSISYLSFRATITEKISRYSLDGLTQAVANVQLKLAEFENISIRLFINKELNTNLASYVKNQEATHSKRMIQDCFNEYMISNKDIFGFIFISETEQADENRAIIITKDFYQDFIDMARRFKDTASYQRIAKARGGIVWSSTIKLNRNNFVILGRFINDINSGEPLGMLAIVVDEEKLDQIVNLTIYNKLYISFDEIENYSLIINNDGEIISSPFKEDIGENISQMMYDLKPLKPILEYAASNRDYGSEINQGSFITKVNNKQTLVTYKAIGSQIGIGGKSGWNLLNLAPTSHLYKEVRIVGVIALLLGLFFGALAVLVSIPVANTLGERDDSSKVKGRW